MKHNFSDLCGASFLQPMGSCFFLDIVLISLIMLIWLYFQLVLEYKVDKGLLPPKKLFGNQSEAFIRKRQSELEVYLQTLFHLLPKIPLQLANFLHFEKYVSITSSLTALSHFAQSICSFLKFSIEMYGFLMIYMALFRFRKFMELLIPWQKSSLKKVLVFYLCIWYIFFDIVSNRLTISEIIYV